MGNRAIKQTDLGLSSLDVGYLFLDMASSHKSKKGYPLTFTKAMLQKLVYIAHGFHLALHDEPLIADTISTGENGLSLESFSKAFPVADDVVITKDMVSEKLFFPGHADHRAFSVVERVFLAFVIYGHFSCEDLDYYTDDLPENKNEISSNVIQLRFRSEVKSNDQTYYENILGAC